MARKLRIAVSVIFGLASLWLLLIYTDLPFYRRYFLLPVDSMVQLTAKDWQVTAAYRKGSDLVDWPNDVWNWGILDEPLIPLLSKSRFGIGWGRFTGGFIITANILYLQLACWTPILLLWKPYRFSLRTTLITTTLVAVVLGLAVWAVR